MEEYFEIFREDGTPAGRAPRSQVHAEGLWHRSTHIFLFRTDGQLLLQLRAADKDLFAGRWDYSVGEHLRPGESYLAGARRGLREELAVTGAALVPLGPRQRQRLRTGRIRDFEFQQAFLASHDGPVTPDPEEVAAVRWLPLTSVHDWATQEPQRFTPWFLRELNSRPELQPQC